MNFALFVFLNAVLLIRPEELFPDGPGVHLYFVAIVLCIITTLPQLISLLSPSSLRYQPIAVCVLVFYASIFVSQIILGRISETLFGLGPECGKLVLYYLLMIAIIDTRERFRAFVMWLVVFTGCLIAIALAQHFDIVTFPNIVPCIDTITDPQTGEVIRISRLVSSGIFNDPNDLCLIVGLGIVSCVYCATSSLSTSHMRYLWFLPIPLFIYALLETHSRGGIIGVLAGCAAYLYSRYGGSKALPLAVAGGLAVLIMVGGRQGSLEGGGTAHQRVMAWAEGLTALYQSPVSMPVGLGVDWFVDETGLVAHNSFVQAYVELGLLGGGVFLAAFYLGVRTLDRFGKDRRDVPYWVVDARSYGIAALVGYAMGCYSITRNFVVPTYLVLGLATVLVARAGSNLPPRFQVTSRWFIWLVVFSVCGLLVITLATQMMGRVGI